MTCSIDRRLYRGVATAFPFIVLTTNWIQIVASLEDVPILDVLRTTLSGRGYGLPLFASASAFPSPLTLPLPFLLPVPFLLSVTSPLFLASCFLLPCPCLSSELLCLRSRLWLRLCGRAAAFPRRACRATSRIRLCGRRRRWRPPPSTISCLSLIHI